MAPRKQLGHRTWSYLNPQYDSYTNPVTPHTEPYIVSGSNVLTSRRGYVERMPGSSVYEATATQLTLSATVESGIRTYIYRQISSGYTFIILGILSAVTAKVYKLLVGVDAAFVELLSVNSSFNFDFVTANDTLYMASGGNVWQYKGVGTTTYAWGINISNTASTTGPNNPSAATSNAAASTMPWVNPTNIFSSNNVYATQDLSLGVPPDYVDTLYATGFSFAIAETQTVVGILVEVELVTSGGAGATFNQVVLLKGGSGGSSNLAASTAVPTSEQYVSFGSSSNLWGATWTPAEINGSGFGVAIQLTPAGYAGTISIDHMRITVYTTGAAAPTTATSGTGITASIGWKYVYTYKNSTTGHISSPSPVSTSTGAVSNKTVTVTGARSTTTGIDKVRVYRSTDGGDGPYYFIYELANPGSGTWSQADTTADTSLDTSYGNQAPPVDNNDPPSAMNGLKNYASRIWGFLGNTLYYSGWEEINTGMEEESFPSGVTGNFWNAPQEITNLAVVPDKLLVFCRSKIFQVTGDNRNTFSFTPLFENMGCCVRYNKGVAEDGERVFWLNYDNRLWVTDGNSKELVSESVTDEFISIATTDFAICVHRYGEYNWLLVGDNNGGTTGANGARLYVLDLNTGKWMPPWTRSTTHAVSAELAAGQFTLLYGSYDGANASQNIIRQVDIPPRTRTYQDTSTPYTANAVFALTDIAPPGLVFESEYVGYERDDSGTPTAPVVRIKADEANSAVTWASESAGTQVNPTLRDAGSTLVEKWAYFKKKCRRILVRFEWTNENKNFKLISLDLTGRIIGGDD